MNAECKAVNHFKQCSCPPGFTGNEEVECVRSMYYFNELFSQICVIMFFSHLAPVSCTSNNDCTSGLLCQDKICVPRCSVDNECAYNEKCLKGTCVLTCRVDNDCFLGHICLRNKCILGCHADEDCGASESCRNNKCINPCLESPCGPNALCTVSNHRATCSCGADFVPNPTAKVACVRSPAQPCTENRECPIGTTCIERLCKTVCSSDQGCLNNERCDVQTGICKALCRRDDDCRTGEICDSLVCVIGCRSDHGCATNRACSNNKCVNSCASPTACGINAECSIENHKKICTCPHPLVGEPLESCKRPLTACYSDSECSYGHVCYGGLCQEMCRT